MLLRFRK